MLRTLIKSAFLSDCSAELTSDGFTISSTYDDCGFQATHENGVLTFSNKVVSDQADNNFGLILGRGTFSFDVSCKFADQRKF